MPSRTAHLQPPNPSFQLFSYLPTELRLQIWRLSSQPRVVEVRYSPSSDRCLTPTPPPAILSVCHESRQEALFAVYVLTLGTKSHAPSIYFSPALDVLYLPRWGDLGYADTARDFGTFVHDTAQWVRRLAIDHVKAEVRRPWETYSKFCLMRNFPGLREAFLVIADGEEGGKDTGAIEFVDPRGNEEEILMLMENVRERFSWEVGPGCFERWKAGEEEKESCGLALVPKCKMAGGHVYPRGLRAG